MGLISFDGEKESILIFNFSLAYLRSFIQGAYYQYIQRVMNARREITYVLCPSCDQSMNSPNSHSQDPKSDEQGAFISGGIGDLYNDHDVEAQPLLPGSTTIADQQSTVTKN